MYRVELKEAGIEILPSPSLCVPNVPCGVERKLTTLTLLGTASFLMYRVELKEKQTGMRIYLDIRLVPNVPCGVESHYKLLTVLQIARPFLMYRVELKGFLVFLLLVWFLLVPNVPCGVESSS